MNWLTPTKKTFNGHNTSCFKKDLLAVNGFNEAMQYGGLDRELGERLFNYGVLAKQVRYSAACLHLDLTKGVMLLLKLGKKIMPFDYTIERITLLLLKTEFQNSSSLCYISSTAR